MTYPSPYRLVLNSMPFSLLFVYLVVRTATGLFTLTFRRLLLLPRTRTSSGPCPAKPISPSTLFFWHSWALSLAFLSPTSRPTDHPRTCLNGRDNSGETILLTRLRKMILLPSLTIIFIGQCSNWKTLSKDTTVGSGSTAQGILP